MKRTSASIVHVSDGNAHCDQLSFQFPNRGVARVQYSRNNGGISSGLTKGVANVFRAARSAGCDDRNVDRLRNEPRDVNLKTLPRSVGID